MYRINLAIKNILMPLVPKVWSKKDDVGSNLKLLVNMESKNVYHGIKNQFRINSKVN